MLYQLSYSRIANNGGGCWIRTNVSITLSGLQPDSFSHSDNPPNIMHTEWFSTTLVMSNGAGDRSRTYDVLITSEVLYQLSYTGISTFIRLNLSTSKGSYTNKRHPKVAIGRE